MTILWLQRPVVVALFCLLMPREVESRALPQGWERPIVFVEFGDSPANHALAISLVCRIKKRRSQLIAGQEQVSS